MYRLALSISIAQTVPPKTAPIAPITMRRQPEADKFLDSYTPRAATGLPGGLGPFAHLVDFIVAEGTSQGQVRPELEALQVGKLACVQRLVKLVNGAATFSNVKVEKIGLREAANPGQLDGKTAKPVEN